MRVLDLAAVTDANADAEVVQGSILDAEVVRRLAKGVDRLFHLAPNPNLWTRRKADFDMVNLEGTRVVLEAAARAGVGRVVYASTGAILKSCRRPTTLPISENQAGLDVDDMTGPYCRSKYLAEVEAKRAATDGLPVVIINPTMPLGPGDRLLTPPTRMLLLFLNGRAPAYYDYAFNMIDVRDAALGFIRAAERGRVGERYLLGGENLHLGQFLDHVHELTGLPMPRLKVPYWLALGIAAVSEFAADHLTGRAPVAPLTDVRLARILLTVDCDKARRELGLPQRPVKSALADAIAWLGQRGLVRRHVAPFDAAAGTPVADR